MARLWKGDGYEQGVCAPAPWPEHVPQLESQSTHTEEALAYLATGVQSDRQDMQVSTGESAVQLPSALKKGYAAAHASQSP